MVLKICKECQEELPLEDFKFCVRRDGRTYRHPYCDECRKDYHKNYYQKRVSEDPDYGKITSRKSTLKKYNLTLEEYQDMLDTQDGLCAICERPPEGNGVSRHNLVIDHDHDSGEVRALLCDFCNRGLGIFKDDPELLIKAAEYLQTHREVRVV